MVGNFAPGSDEEFAAICREQHWKRTAQRRAVFTFLCGNRGHPNVEAVWHGVRVTLPDISLDSVYRILDDFTAAGIVRRLEGAKILRYDSDTRPHGHFVCSRCGRMEDFSCIDPERVAEHCREFGTIEAVELTARGVCRRCLEDGNAAAAL